jgi:hypothetical protein
MSKSRLVQPGREVGAGWRSTAEAFEVDRAFCGDGRAGVVVTDSAGVT